MKKLFSLLLCTGVGVTSLASSILQATASPANSIAQAEKTMVLPSGQSLSSTEWLLEDLGGQGVIDRAQTTLRFNDTNRISGQGGCNQYSAGAELKGDRLTVSAIASTRKACMPVLMDQEIRYFQALQKAGRIRVEGAYLLIESEGMKAPLKFTQLNSSRPVETLPIVFEGTKHAIRIFNQNGQIKMNVYNKRDRVTWMRGVPATVKQTGAGTQYANTFGKTRVVVSVPKSGEPSLSINGVVDSKGKGKD